MKLDDLGSENVVQVVEYLPNKCEALNSKPSTVGKKMKGNKLDDL
jgi:hypothetical protein